MSLNTTPSRRGRMVIAVLLTALVSVVIRDGADRRPADPSRPLNSQGLNRPVCNRETLRIASFNIHSGKGDGDVVDLKRTAAVLNEKGFDFAGLYEVRSPFLIGFDSQADEISMSCEYCGSIFAPTESHWWHEHFGNAILTKHALGTVQRIPWPGTRGKAFRNAVLTELPWRDRTVKILSTHIDRHEDRKAQLRLAIALFLALEPPAVLMGDLNTPLTDPQLTTLWQTPGVRSPLHDALGGQLPADNIDWMFMRGLRTVTAELTENPASDHPVLRAELALEE